MADGLQRLLEDASRIPAAPGIAIELARSCDDPDVTIDHLVDILKCDPSLTAKVLRMANSAYFASRREIADLTEAVVRLGLRRVQIIALALCVMEATSGADASGGFNYAYFWNHALVTATFADMAAATLRMPLAPEAMVCGLLQDIGVLVIQTGMPAEYRDVLAMQARDDIDLHVAETRKLGFNHTEAGETMLRRWHLPDLVCRIIRHHHEPQALKATSSDAFRLAAICYLGAMVAKFLTSESRRPRLLTQAAEQGRELLGLDHESLKAILARVRMRIEATADMFDMRLDETTVRRLDAALRDRVADSVLEIADTHGAGY